MTATTIRVAGLLTTILYTSFIVWIFSSQPRNIAEVTGGVAATLGAYRIDDRSFNDGLRFFRNDQFVEARSAFLRADPAERDPRTQFYVAYSFYREGWGRLYNDDTLFQSGLEALNRAVAVSPDGTVRVDDPTLTLRTADELKAELERGLARDLSDLNPLRVLQERK